MTNSRITFEKEEEARAALTYLRGQEFKRKSIYSLLAVPKQQRRSNKKEMEPKAECDELIKTVAMGAERDG